VSRAGVIKATSGVPMDKAFGSVMAERAIDVVCLFLCSGIALILSYDKIDDLIALKDVVNNNSATDAEPGFPWVRVILLSLFLLGMIFFAILWFKNPNFKEKVI